MNLFESLANLKNAVKCSCLMLFRWH